MGRVRQERWYDLIMKLKNVDSILMALEAFKQGNNMATLNVGGSKASDQNRGSVKEGVQGGDHSSNSGELLMSICAKVMALGVDSRSNDKTLRRQNSDDSFLAEQVRRRERNISGGFNF